MFDATFERRLRAALRVSAGSPADDVRLKAAIMARVRATADTAPPRANLPSGRRGMVRHSIAGLALAASLGSVATFSSILPKMRGGGVDGPVVIGDTVVGTLRDTLRLVRLMLDAPAAHRVAIIGDFNAWDVGSAPMRLDPGTRRWSATVALRDGAHRYAFVVDGTRWVPDASARLAPAEGARAYAVLHVAPAGN